MSDTLPTWAEGVRLVRHGESVTTELFNETRRTTNRQSRAVRPPRQIDTPPVPQQPDVQTGIGFAIVVGLGDETGLWLTVRTVTLNDAADGYDVGIEDLIAMTPPGMQDVEKYFGWYLVEPPLPGTLTEPTIQVMDTALVGGVLYVYQTNRMNFGPFPVNAGRSDCGPENF